MGLMAVWRTKNLGKSLPLTRFLHALKDNQSGQILMSPPLASLDLPDIWTPSSRRSIPAIHKSLDEFNFRNVVSSRAVEKLCLPTTNGQAMIKFSIGTYEDEVLCDIAPMETCHMLLGRPWLYNKIINPERPSISFVHGGRRIKLICLSSDDVHEDQLKLKIKIEKEREEKRRVEDEIHREEDDNSNVTFSSFDVSNLQEQEDKFSCLKKHVNIIPNAPLYIQSTFQNKIQETLHLENGVDLLFEVTIFQSCHLNGIQFLFIEYVCGYEFEEVLFVSLMINNLPTGEARDGYKRDVFDPGGSIYVSAVVSELNKLGNK